MFVILLQFLFTLRITDFQVFIVQIEEVEDEKKSAPSVSRLLKESLTSTGCVQATIGSAEHSTEHNSPEVGIEKVTCFPCPLL